MIVSYDLETAGNHIVCIGFAWSRMEAICIPFSTGAGMIHYWSAEEEAQLIFLLYKIMTHPKFQGVGQNLLFDNQYIFRHWHFIPRHHFDTMIGHHSCFSTTPKSLDYLASLYCEYYQNWKGVARLIDKQGVKKDD